MIKVREVYCIDFRICNRQENSMLLPVGLLFTSSYKKQLSADFSSPTLKY
jgi:hypothetical protein